MRLVHAHAFNATRGGSDVMFSATIKLLRESGHAVETLERNAADISGVIGHAVADGLSLHSESARREMRALVRDFRPDVVHLHNLYPLLSPSVVEPCRASGIPLLMSLADHSLVCPTGSLSREDSHCTLCLEGHEHRCVVTRCAGSFVASAALALRTASARIRRVFLDGIDLFTTPSETLRTFYVHQGFPAARVVTLPNFVEVPRAAAQPELGRYLAYLGRISREKGIAPLLEAAARSGVPTRIAGAGTATFPQERVAPNVTFVGELSGAEVLDFLRNARCLVVPSVGQETFSLSAAEAMAMGIPVIASRIGALPETVPQAACAFVPPGDVAALAIAMRALWDDPARAAVMGAAGRQHALRHYSKQLFYDRLVALYRNLGATAA